MKVRKALSLVLLLILALTLISSALAGSPTALEARPLALMPVAAPVGADSELPHDYATIREGAPPTPTPTPKVNHLSCENKDNEEKFGRL